MGDFPALESYINTQLNADSRYYNYALQIYHKTV